MKNQLKDLVCGGEDFFELRFGDQEAQQLTASEVPSHLPSGSFKPYTIDTKP